jgi:hypothetical protein
MNHLARCLLVVSSLAWCSACSDDEGAAPHAEDPAQHACEHADHAGTPLTASTDRAAAPVLAVADVPYAVALPSNAPGFVRIEAPLEGVLFVGAPDVVTGLYRDDGTTSEPLEASPNEHCPDEIPEHHDFDLDAGSLTVQLGPSAVSPIWLLLTSSAGHHHK